MPLLVLLSPAWSQTGATDHPSDFPDLPVWAPTVQDVADLCPAYTRPSIDSPGLQAGAERGVFDSTTSPNEATVQRFIAAAVEEVIGRVGYPDLPSNVQMLARRAAAWNAAATVEAERGPAGADDAEGSYRWKQSSYVACLNELVVQARMTPLRLV